MSDAHAATMHAERSVVARDARDHWLFIDAADAFGGHEVMLLRWLEELAAQGSVQCSLLARGDSQLAREASRAASVMQLPKRRAGRLQSMIGSCRDAMALFRAAVTIKPDLCVVAEGSLLAQPLFAPLARLLGLRVLVYVPLVQTSASMGFGNGRIRDAIVRRIYAHVPHGWITITQEQARDFRAWAGVRGPILVLPNTVANALENHGQNGGARAAVARPRRYDARLRVLVLGRIEAHQKGLDALIEFASAHPELGSRMQISCIGNGPYEAEMRSRLASDALLASWVSLQSWSAPLDALGAHDVLLMTSRYEGVPLVMLEAMALRVPVIAPDLAGTRAFLPRTELFPRGDMRAAFRCLEAMIEPATRQVAAQRNRATFEASASNAAFSAAVKALTEQLQQLGSAKLRRRSA